ncbi:hypothetical protein HHK36_015552 [Tetracentron sinense]|uniref:Pentatricopeptide repeat-containing protein n=1 Tax=Tetracentron sinense TaxID=13715 RepID=A0A834Z9F5_TETSI|nr:hypothetical protein HHK36_015552 [Tetracentron sinense]
MQTRVVLPFARKIATWSALSSPSSLWEFQRISHLDVYSYNLKINDLMKSACLNSALQLFESMPVHDVISWNLVISGHARHGIPQQAFVLFKQMVSRGIRETPSTCSSVLGICSDAGFCREGLQVHCRVVLLGFNLNLFVGSALVDLYMQIGLADRALQLFEDLPVRSSGTWNLVLRGFCELSRSNGLLELYSKMKLDGVEANGVTFCYLIRGCSIGGFLDEGKQLHCHVSKSGWLHSNLFIANALVDFYSACGSWIDARKSIEIIRDEDVISWNSIVSVYANNGLLPEALVFFARMQSWGKKPSVRSFVGFLNYCSATHNHRFGEQVHSYVLKLGFDHGSVYVQSALIDMYGKCGEIESSVFLFNEIPERTLECCNSLMTSLLYCGIIEDVIELYGLMVDEGVGLDHVTFSTALKALSSSALASLASCELLHCCLIKSGFETDISVLCSLIDAYSRYGHINLASQIFEQIIAPNVICFTSIIAGYARNGKGRECIEMLETMIKKGLKPDALTFLSVLAGCNHSGLVEEGRLVFKFMRTVHGIYPDRRHYSCMVDLLGRAGLLEDAEELLKLAPVKDDTVMWSSLLRSCRVHRNETVGRRAVKALMELEPEDPAAYLQASAFYSEIGDSETSMQIREIKVARKMRREIGYSLIEDHDYGYS